jgi:hypothetical protein
VGWRLCRQRTHVGAIVRDLDKEFMLENEKELHLIIELRRLRRLMSRLALAVVLLGIAAVLHSVLWVITVWP